MAQMKRIFRSLLSWSLGIMLVSSAISLLAAWLFFVSEGATFANHTLMASVKQKVRDYVVSFSIPVGALFNKQFAIPIWVLISLFVANIYGISFTMAEIVPVVILSMILSVAVPPSPGIGPFLFTIIFNLLHIPLDGLALAVTIAIFMNYPATAGNAMVTNIGMLHTEHMLCAKEIKVDYKAPVLL